MQKKQIMQLLWYISGLSVGVPQFFKQILANTLDPGGFSCYGGQHICTKMGRLF